MHGDTGSLHDANSIRSLRPRSPVTRRRLLGGGLATAGALALGGVAGPGSLLRSIEAAGQEKIGGEIMMNMRHSGFPGWDSRFGNDGRAEPQFMIYDQLVRNSADGRTIVPALAERWDISDDGLVYTFHLREALFHDGSPVTAEDVVYSLDRVRNDDRTYLHSALPALNLQAPDQRTVVVRSEQLWAPMLGVLTTGEAAILPMHVVEEQKALFFRRPVGSGPFKLDSWEEAGPFVFSRHAQWWDEGKPRLDKVTLKFVEQPDTLAALFERGELDIAYVIAGEEIAAFTAMPNAVVARTNAYGMTFANFNLTRPPFDDKLLRHAANYAIDKQAIVDEVLSGAGKPQNTFVPEIAGHDDAAVGYPFDREKAKALVAKSSSPDGFDVELMVPPGTPPFYQAVKEKMIDQLAAIGAKVSLIPDSEFDARARSGDFDLMMFGAGSNSPSEPFDMMGLVRSDVTPVLGYANERVDALLAAAEATTDWPTRERAYFEVQALVNEDAPFLYVSYDENLSVAAPHVGGFAEHGPRLTEVWREDA